MAKDGSFKIGRIRMASFQGGENIRDISMVLAALLFCIFGIGLFFTREPGHVNRFYTKLFKHNRPVTMYVRIIATPKDNNGYLAEDLGKNKRWVSISIDDNDLKEGDTLKLKAKKLGDEKVIEVHGHKYDSQIPAYEVLEAEPAKVEKEEPSQVNKDDKH